MSKMMEVELPFGYPNFPGAAPTDTSQEAAEKIAPKRQLLWTRIYAALEEAPATCAEMEERLGLTHQACSPRFTEMRDKGWIEDTGLRRKTPSGVNAIVWAAVEHG